MNDNQTTVTSVNLLRTTLAARLTRDVSVTVFDTVLTRVCADMASVYRRTADLVAERHGLAMSRDAFAAERVSAARRASYNRQGRAVSLREIHVELCFVLGVPHLVDALVTAELAAETELIVSVPGAVDLVAAARAGGGSVTYLSHSPLPVCFVRDALDRFGLLHPADRILAAHESGAPDGASDLPAAAMHRHGGTERHWLPVGDSTSREIAPARRSGRHGLHDAAADSSAGEHVLLNLSRQLVDTASFLAGSARLTRLRAPDTLTSEQRVAWTTGATVTGPLVYCMARRLLDRARARGIKKLLFLARDGLLPFLAVQSMLQDEAQDGPTAAYVYGSRATYYPLTCQRLGPDEWDELTSFFGKNYETLGELCDALGIEPALLQEHLRRLTGGTIPIDATLSADLLGAVKRHATEDPALNAALTAGIVHLQDMLLEHLRQLGLGPGESVGLVDAGWSGRSHGPLYRFLQTRNASAVTMFYVGHPVVGSFQPLFAPEDVETLLFNEHVPVGYCNFYFHPSLAVAPLLDISYPQTVEMLCHADHGRTIGFRERDGRVTPLLREHENQAFVSAVFETYRSAVLCFVADMHGRRALLPAYENLAHVAQQICERFWLRPTQAEVGLWKRWVWANDPHDRELFPITSPYRVRDALPVLWHGRLPHRQPQFWTQAALILSPAPIRLLLVGLLAIRARIARAVPPGIARRVAAVKRRLALRWLPLESPR